MIVYPNAKINIGLNITEKRTDGFHNLESFFVPIDICDILELTASESENEFNSTGIEIPGDSSNNLCLKAWELLNDDYQISPVSVHLHKVIPIGAGLGGGSADGAFMLKALNELFGLELSNTQLEGYAAQLGSDCAFFIRNQPALAEGRGEILSPTTEIPGNLHIILVNPGIHISTKEAYSGITPTKPANSLKELIQEPIGNWQNKIINDFEPEIAKNHPSISEIKTQLIESGASYAAMTGSGSSVFGLFEKEVPDNLAQRFSDYFYWQGKLMC